MQFWEQVQAINHACKGGRSQRSTSVADLIASVMTPLTRVPHPVTSPGSSLVPWSYL